MSFQRTWYFINKLESLFALGYHTCKTLFNFKAGFYTTRCLLINDCSCRHSLTEPSKQFYCYSLKKLQLITIFLLQLQGPYALALMSSLRNISQWNVKSTIFARRKESTPSAMHLIGQIWALTSNFQRTSFCMSNRFILNHVDNWTKQWQAGAAQLPLLGAPCFLLDKSDLFVIIFVN